MVSNCLDAHLGQIVCDKDAVVVWCIVQGEMPLTQFEEYWPLPTESLPKLPYNLNTVTLTLTLWPINSGVITSLLLTLKFTNCDNQALVGCIPIAAIAVNLNLKS